MEFRRVLFRSPAGPGRDTRRRDGGRGCHAERAPYCRYSADAEGGCSGRLRDSRRSLYGEGRFRRAQRAPAGRGRRSRKGAPVRQSAQRGGGFAAPEGRRSEEHTSELQSLMRISYAVLCLKKKKTPMLHNFKPANIEPSSPLIPHTLLIS